MAKGSIWMQNGADAPGASRAGDRDAQAAAENVFQEEACTKLL